jgi:hypothetical protein
VYEEALDDMQHTETSMRGSLEEYARMECYIANEAEGMLLTVLRSADPTKSRVERDEHREPTGSLALARLLAQRFIGVRILRATRAARALLEIGFEPEARVFERILLELDAHRRAIDADPTGEEARAWLSRERIYKTKKKIEAVGLPGDVWEMANRDSHGDPGPVLALADGKGTIGMHPRRTPETRWVLILHAKMARDQALLIAQGEGTPLSVTLLDSFVQQASDALHAQHGIIHRSG